ncbi:MAG: serine/threonine-protein kinase, partial [Polyangiaceae bacterium]
SEAIAEAHALGIVHRDLKPANIFLTQRADGSAWVKVLDFGISRMTPRGEGNGDDSEDRLTGAGMVMGSPHYMSPEQLRSTRNVDQRSDVWSLGTILHELLSGEPAFDAPGGFTAICARIMDDGPAPLAKLRPDIPAGLITVILRCLEKDPDARFRSVAELALALVNFASPAGRESARLIAGILHGYADKPTGGILVRPSQIPWGSTNSAWVGVPKPKARRGVDKRVAVAALLFVGTGALATYVYSANNSPALVVATGQAPAKTEVDAGRAVEAVVASSAPAVSVAATPPPRTARPPRWRPPAAVTSASVATPTPQVDLFDERK